AEGGGAGEPPRLQAREGRPQEPAPHQERAGDDAEAALGGPVPGGGRLRTAVRSARHGATGRVRYYLAALEARRVAEASQVTLQRRARGARLVEGEAQRLGGEVHAHVAGAGEVADGAPHGAGALGAVHLGHEVLEGRGWGGGALTHGAGSLSSVYLSRYRVCRSAASSQAPARCRRPAPARRRKSP